MGEEGGGSWGTEGGGGGADTERHRDGYSQRMKLCQLVFPFTHRYLSQLIAAAVTCQHGPIVPDRAGTNSHNRPPHWHGTWDRSRSRGGPLS